MTAFPKASISPWWSVSRSLPALFGGYSHLRKPFQSRAAFSFGLPHFNPAKLGPSSRAGSEEGKILSCLTFCKKLGQISEVNHHEWSHLRVRPARDASARMNNQAEWIAGRGDCRRLFLLCHPLWPALRSRRPSQECLALQKETDNNQREEKCQPCSLLLTKVWWSGMPGRLHLVHSAGRWQTSHTYSRISDGGHIPLPCYTTWPEKQRGRLWPMTPLGCTLLVSVRPRELWPGHTVGSICPGFPKWKNWLQSHGQRRVFATLSTWRSAWPPEETKMSRMRVGRKPVLQACAHLQVCVLERAKLCWTLCWAMGLKREP